MHTCAWTHTHTSTHLPTQPRCRLAPGGHAYLEQHTWMSCSTVCSVVGTQALAIACIYETSPGQEVSCSPGGPRKGYSPASPSLVHNSPLLPCRHRSTTYPNLLACPCNILLLAQCFTCHLPVATVWASVWVKAVLVLSTPPLWDEQNERPILEVCRWRGLLGTAPSGKHGSLPAHIRDQSLNRRRA